MYNHLHWSRNITIFCFDFISVYLFKQKNFCNVWRKLHIHFASSHMLQFSCKYKFLHFFLYRIKSITININRKVIMQIESRNLVYNWVYVVSKRNIFGVFTNENVLLCPFKNINFVNRENLNNKFSTSISYSFWVCYVQYNIT